MTKKTQDKGRRASLGQQASDWFVSFRDDDLRYGERLRGVRWLKKSPEHIAELLRVQQLHRMLREAHLDENHTSAPPPEAVPNVVKLFPGHGEVATNASTVRRRLIAASVAVITLSILVGILAKTPLFDQRISTERGEWRSVTLADRTNVLVAPGSTLRISLEDTQRTVRLMRGEAKFDVARDPHRPFLVVSDLVRVVVVGTAFRVSQQDGRDIVAVTEGTVAVYNTRERGSAGHTSEVAARPTHGAGALSITAGEQLTVPRLGPISKGKLNHEHERDWAEGWLTFENSTLGEIAQAFNRRSRVQIVLDEELARRRMSYFRSRATDPEAFVAALKSGLRFDVERDATGHFHLRSVRESVVSDVGM